MLTGLFYHSSTTSLKKMLIVLISLQTVHAFATCTYSDDSEMTELMKKCTAASMKWDCDLNRCMTKEEAIAVREQSAACQEIADASKRKACFDDLSKQEASSKNLKSTDGTEMMSGGVYGVTVGMVALSYLSKKSTATCTSKTIFTAAAGAYLATEIYQYFFMGKKLEELRKEYEKKTVVDDQYNAQIDAFLYLKEEQTEIKKMAETKQKIYLGLAAVYGAASAVAAYEVYSQTGCKGTETQNEDKAKPATPPETTPTVSINYFLNEITSIFIARVLAASSYGGKKPLTSFLPVLLGASAPVILAQNKTFGKYFYNSTGIAVVSGIASGMSIYLSSVHKSVAQQAEENIKKIDAALAEFKSDQSSFCPGGHDDLSNPKCYCYNTDGTHYEDHSASETCQNLWKTTNLYVEAGDYSDSTAQSNACVMLDSTYDENCDCERMINLKGENACLKVDASTFASGNLASAINGVGTAETLNSITSGKLPSTTLNGLTLEQQAARNRKTADALLRTATKNKISLPTNKQGAELLSKLVSPALLKSANQAKHLLTPETLQATALGNKNPAIQKAIEQSGIELNYQSNAAKSATPKNEDSLQFDFSSGNSPSSSKKELEFSATQNSKINFPNSDISESNGPSLWKIITDRYNKSAFEMLFSGEQTDGKTK